MGLNIQNLRSAKVYRATDQTITTGTATALSFSTVVSNVNSLWALADPTKITIDKDGFYLVSVGVEWAADATGLRTLQVQKNGTSGAYVLQASQAAPASGAGYQTLTGLVYLANGDYVEAIVTHSKGSDLAVTGNATRVTPHFSLMLQHPAYDSSANSEAF